MAEDFTEAELRRHLTRAAAARAKAHQDLHQWIGRAYGHLPVTEIARLAGLTPPGVYHVLDHLGIARRTNVSIE